MFWWALSAGSIAAAFAPGVVYADEPLSLARNELSVEVPAPPELELDRVRLGVLLEDRALLESEGETFVGIALLGAGALELGLGLWIALDDGTFSSLDSLRWATAGLAIPFGGLAIAVGIASLSMVGLQRDRLRRWRLATDGGLDARALGRFEGELRADAEAGRVLRGFEAATGFGMAGGGAVLVLTTALTAALSSADEIEQLYGYGLGGVFTAAGLISGLVALLVESDAEDTWRAYLAGERPDAAAAAVDLTLSPSASEDGFGVSLQGRF